MALLNSIEKDVEEKNPEGVIISLGALVGLFYGIKTGKSNLAILFCVIISSSIAWAGYQMANKK